MAREIIKRICSCLMLFLGIHVFLTVMAHFWMPLHDFFIAHPTSNERVFYSNHLFNTSNYILFALFFTYGLYIARKQKVIQTKPIWLKLGIASMCVGAVLSLFWGTSNYIKVNKNGTIYVTTGFIRKNTIETSYDKVKVNNYEIRMSYKGGGRIVQFYDLELPDGKKVWNIDNVRGLISVLHNMSKGNLKIKKIEETESEHREAYYSWTIDAFTIGFIPLAFYFYLDSKSRKERRKKKRLDEAQESAQKHG